MARFHLGLLPLVLLLSTAAPVRLEIEYRRARHVALFQTPHAALEIVETALCRASDPKDPWVVALRVYRAELRAMTTGEFQKALPILAAPLPPHLRKTEIEIRRLGALAMVLYLLGRTVEAHATTDRMVALASKDVPAMAAEAYYMRGNLRTEEADIQTAIRLANAKGDAILALRSEALFVRAFWFSGQFAKAAEVGERVVPRMEKAGLSGVGTIAGNVGSAYFSLGDYELAREYFLRAEAASRNLSTSHDYPVWLDRLGDVSLALHDLDGAERWYRRAERFERDHEHRQLPRTLSNLALIAMARRQPEARRLIAEGLDRDIKAKDGENIQRARIVRASLEIESRNFDLARKELEDVLTRSKDPFTRLRADTGLGRLYAAQHENDLADQYFARAMRTAVDERGAIHPDYRVSFFNSVLDLFDTYLDFLFDTGQIVKALEVTEEIRARTLAEGLGAIASNNELDAPAIAGRTNATILVYWLGMRRSYVWTVKASGVSIRKLPPAAVIEREVDQYQKVIQSESLSECAPRGQRLLQMLVPSDVRGVARESKVIVIADGKLHRLNFETLVVPAPRPHWWIDDVVVTSANSLQLLGRPAATRTAAPALLLVGNAPQADPAFAPLPNARLEMEKIQTHFARTRVLSGRAATPKAFLAAGPAAFDVIHFVAHGIASRTRPLESAVILAKDDTKHYKLYARDVVAQHLTARLVTISSCHGAGGRAYAGEGLVGLAWAFLRAGADQVIAALWEVDDAATTNLMDSLYGRMRDGRNPAEALRDAKRALIHSGTIYQKPKYWAPFVIYAGS